MRANRLKWGLCSFLIAVGLLTSSAAAWAAEQENPSAVAGQQQSQQVQSTDERLQNQDQRIKDLEKRLHDLESAAMAGKVPAAPPAAAPAAAEASKTERLEVSAGQGKETHQVLTGADLTSKEFPGSWPLFGTDFRMKIGGYFKWDALYDIDGTGDKFQFLISQIPVDGTPEAGRGGYFNMLVRETRFNFDIRKTTPGETPQQVFIEMDFFDETSSSPRLRHAYLAYGNLIIGQTWSTLTELRAVPYMIDFSYGDALFGTRAVQVRWQQQAGKNWSWAVALEQPRSQGIDNPSALPGVGSPAMPNLVARATYESSSTVATLGGMVQQLRWDGEGAGPNATATAWAAELAGRQNIGASDYVTLGVTYGAGIADTMGSLASNANATLLPDGHLETIPVWNVALGYSHKWSNALSTNLSYAKAELRSQYRAPDDIKGGWEYHANLIWNVTKKMLTGIEYMWGERENMNGAKGDAARVQTTVHYFF